MQELLKKYEGYNGSKGPTQYVKIFTKIKRIYSGRIVTVGKDIIVFKDKNQKEVLISIDDISSIEPISRGMYDGEE